MLGFLVNLSFYFILGQNLGLGIISFQRALQTINSDFLHFYINTVALRTLPSCHMPCKQYKNRTSKPWFHSLLTSNSHCLWLHIMVCIFLSVSMYIPEILILRDILLPFKCVHCNRYFSRKRCSAITAIFAAVLLSDALSVRKKL